MHRGRVAQIRPFDIANGPGVRVSLFVSGCTHACPGCFNALYQDFHYGNQWEETDTDTVIEYLKNPVISGLTLLGGEPLQNLWLTPIIHTIRQAVDTNIWVYSGYTWEQIVSHTGRRALVSQCDVVVDGLFKQELLDLNLKFRGSSNQRIIDVPASLHAQDVVLHMS